MYPVRPPRRFLAALSTSLAALATPLAAAAEQDATLAPFVYDPAEPQVLTLDGAIGSRAPTLFKRALQRFPEVTTLALSSQGGVIYAALPIAYELRDAGLTTVIPEGASCQSACAYLFLAGQTRRAAGTLGVHRIASGSNDLAQGQVALGDVFAAFEEWGVPPAVYTDMMSTPADEMFLYTPDDMVAIGLVAAPDAPDAPGGAGEPDEPGETAADRLPDTLPEALSIDMVFVFDDAERATMQSQITMAQWLADQAGSSACGNGEAKPIEGGLLCLETASGKIADELAGDNDFGVEIASVGDGIFSFTWDLDIARTGVFGQLSEDQRSYWRSNFGDDRLSVEVRAEKILETNGTLSQGATSASLSLPYSEALAPVTSDDRHMLTALVRAKPAP